MTSIESQEIRGAARNHPCTMNIAGVCNYDPATTVAGHLPDESHGISRKSDDISLCFICCACHDVIDGRAPWPPDEKQHREWYFRRAMVRTWRSLIGLGIVRISDVQPQAIDWEGF